MLKILLLTMLVGLNATLLIASGHAEDPTGSENPLEVCEHSSKIYYWSSDLKFECNTNYIHIFSKSGVSRPQVNHSQVRIGTFNLFHLGDGMAPMKRLSLVAKIIDQWDVVAVQELMPLPARWAEINREVFAAVSDPSFDPNTAPTNWRVFEPGYLQLLNELHKIDPSWSLIVQSNPESPRTEMSGFFYRSSRARVKTWDYCKKVDRLPNIACSLAIPVRQRMLMSRNAFAAYFQSGDFDFIALTTHVRFRPPQSKTELALQIEEVCANYESDKPCKISKDKMSRFYEVKAISDQIPKLLKTDRDVLFMGDYNLEITRKNDAFWNAALKAAPGFTVYQEGKTSISIPHQDLASNYDHFILNPAVSKNCDVEGISVYDFTGRGNGPSDPIIRDRDGMQSEGDWLAFIRSERERVSTLVRAEDRQGRKVLVPINRLDQDQLIGFCETSMERMRASFFGAYMELISDHLPVAMVCDAQN